MITVFFSLDTNTERASSFNIRRVRQLLDKYGVTTEIVIGCYNGKPETTIRAKVETDGQLLKIREIATLHKQESILIVNSDMDTLVEYLDNGRVVNTGTFVNVPSKLAGSLEAWTYIPHENKYYACL